MEVASQATSGGPICGRMSKKATFKKCGRCLTMCNRTSGPHKHAYCQRFTDYCQRVYCRPLKKAGCNKSDVCKFDKDTNTCLHNSEDTQAEQEAKAKKAAKEQEAKAKKAAEAAKVAADL